MSETFSQKLDLVLKALSISRGRLAADMAVDKSAVGRWMTGAVTPSGHNIANLSALIAKRVPGFTTLDWDRSLAELARVLGAESALAAPPSPLDMTLPVAIMEQVRATTALRGAAYEGFFRSTRPYLMNPGRFLHDHSMVRLDETGLLRTKIGSGGTIVEGWVLPLQNQLFIIGADTISGSLTFGIFNGVATPRADVIDGLALGAALDVGRTPTAFAIMYERIGELTDDPEADDQTFARLAAGNPVAPEGSVPQAVQDHLVRDIGPEALAAGGDLLLRMPLVRSMARGPSYLDG